MPRALRLRIMLALFIKPTWASTPHTLAPRVFEPLPLGTIAPEGWLLEQVVFNETFLCIVQLSQTADAH